MSFQFIHADQMFGTVVKKTSIDCQSMIMFIKNFSDDNNMDHDYLNYRLFHLIYTNDGRFQINNGKRGCQAIIKSDGFDVSELNQFLVLADQAICGLEKDLSEWSDGRIHYFKKSKEKSDWSPCSNSVIMIDEDVSQRVFLCEVSDNRTAIICNAAHAAESEILGQGYVLATREEFELVQVKSFGIIREELSGAKSLRI